MRNAVKLLLISLSVFLSGITLAAERVTYFVPDAVGSPIAAMDAQGNLLWRETYTPYGKRTTSDQNNSASPSYTGKPEDPDTGLVYMGARAYDPESARFTGIDPQGFNEGNPQTFGRYVYANNSPYRYNDPNGETPVEGSVSLLWDVGQVVAALSTGAPVGPALVDVGLDAVGFFSPMPGTGMLLKSGHKANKITQGIRESRAARHAETGVTEEGEQFVRIAAKTKGLKLTPSGGVEPGTYAFPKSSFMQLLASPEGVKSLGDVPGGKQSVFSVLSPPAGTPIKRGTVPGGEFGGVGGAPEAIFPQGF